MTDEHAKRSRVLQAFSQALTCALRSEDDGFDGEWDFCLLVFPENQNVDAGTGHFLSSTSPETAKQRMTEIIDILGIAGDAIEEALAEVHGSDGTDTDGTAVPDPERRH